LLATPQYYREVKRLIKKVFALCGKKEWQVVKDDGLNGASLPSHGQLWLHRFIKTFHVALR
jgi:hypothetical protein